MECLYSVHLLKYMYIIHTCKLMHMCMCISPKLIVCKLIVHTSVCRFGLTTQNLVIQFPGMTNPVVVVVPSRQGYQSIGVRLSQQRLTVLVDCAVLSEISVEEPLERLNITGQEATVLSEPATVRFNPNGG